MKESQYWLAGTATVATLLLAWFAGRWLRLSGTDLWVMRSGISFIGLSVIGALLWPRIRAASADRKAASERKSADGRPGDGSANGDIASLVHEAESATGRKLSDLPVVLVLDSSPSLSGGVIENSGLNAEPIASISGAKAWFAQNIVFIELKSQFYSGPKVLGELTRSFASRRFRYLFAKAPQPSRAVVLALPCKAFTDRDKKEEVKTRAEDLRSRLREISRTLGIRMPFYVVFTGLDEVSHFKEYASHLPSDVLADPFGASLRDEGVESGVWSEQQSKRNTRGFRQLFELLSARRLEILNEEQSHDRRRGAYLFPREFRKLARGGPMGDFLLEVARPHQLGSSPYLRGFYFTGVLETQRAKPAAEPTEDLSTPDLSGNLDLSRVFSGKSFERPSVSRPTPRQMEWVFLQRLFAEVILPDLDSLRSTFVSRRASVGRRVLLCALSASILLWATAITVSYKRNKSLQTRAMELSNALRAPTTNPEQRISAEQLGQLESLHALLADLGRYRRDGHPWSLGMGLYAGNQLYPPVRKAYFDNFERLMLGPAQAVLRKNLSLNPAAGVTASFDSTYESLKAYLITRSHPDKSTREFLSPVLLRSWQTQQGNDAERATLAKAQFDFYSDEWRTDPPYPRRIDDEAIAAGRDYLRDNFGGIDRIYSLLKADASRDNPPIGFSGEDVVVNTPKVPGAFTKVGFAAMQKMLRNPGRWSAENWVVTMPKDDGARTISDLPARYSGDYIKEWTAFLGNSRVVACRNRTAADTAKRLTLLSETTESPLLKLFCVASQNTDVDSEEIKNAFQPVHAVVSPQCDKQYSNKNNRAYTTALFDIKGQLEQISAGPQGVDARAAIAPQISTARTAVHDLQAELQVGAAGQIAKTVLRLLDEPISGAEKCVPGLEIGSVCSQFNSALKTKYPFNRTATPQATATDIDTFFNPRTGLLEELQQQVLKNLVVEQGGQYVQNPLAPRPIRSDFLAFLNRSARVRNAFYPKGSQEIQMPLSIQVTPSPVIASVIIKIGDQVQTFSGERAETKAFIWNTNTRGAELHVLLSGGLHLSDLGFDGQWGIFRLIDNMTLVSQSESRTSFEWMLRERMSNKEVHDQSGNPVKIRLDLLGDSGYIFRAEGRSGLQCVSSVTQ